MDSDDELPLSPAHNLTNDQLRKVRMSFQLCSRVTHDTDKALQAAQLQLGNLNTEMQALRLEKATFDTSSSISGINSSKCRSKKATDPQLAAHDKEIMTLAKKFGIMMQPWIDVAAFGQPRPADVQRKVLDPKEYLSSKEIRARSIDDLYLFVPAHLHDFMQNHSHFSNHVGITFEIDSNLQLLQFRTSLSTGRSANLHRLRANATLIFKGIPAESFMGTQSRQNEPLLQALLKFDMTKSKYPYLAPILYPDLKKVESKIFLNPVLPLVSLSTCANDLTSCPHPRSSKQFYLDRVSCMDEQMLEGQSLRANCGM
jgi:hypothetical protein